MNFHILTLFPKMISPLFEEGVKLTETLRSHLDAAEQRIQVLMKDGDGNTSEKDFEG